MLSDPVWVFQNQPQPDRPDCTEPVQPIRIHQNLAPIFSVHLKPTKCKHPWLCATRLQTRAFHWRQPRLTSAAPPPPPHEVIQIPASLHCCCFCMHMGYNQQQQMHKAASAPEGLQSCTTQSLHLSLQPPMQLQPSDDYKSRKGMVGKDRKASQDWRTR